jgi:hypothetical protein
MRALERVRLVGEEQIGATGMQINKMARESEMLGTFNS